MNAATTGAPTLSPEVVATRSDLLIPRPYRVIDRIEEIADVVTLHVVPVEGELPSFGPAQVSMLGAFGVGEAAISLSSAVANHEYHAYTIRRAGPISGALVDTPIGGVITVRGPFGNVWPLDDLETSQLIVIAGGLGLAPLRAVLHQAVHRIAMFDRLGIIYGAREPAAVLYKRDLEEWRNAGAEVAFIVDTGTPEWDGAVGVAPDLLDSDDGIQQDWDNTTAFLCGPDVMMHFTALRLIELGVPENRIWLTIERNMQCGNALCGHCQLGPFIVCRDGPVASYETIRPFHQVREM